MTDPIRVTVLVENTVYGRHIRAEHGLAFWIESGTHRVLFDTGQTPEVLFHNAECLGIDLTTADAVVLSHGHDDHTGGLETMMTQGKPLDLFLHPGALAQRYSRGKDGTVQEIGMPRSHSREELEAKAASVTWTRECTPVVEGIWVTGEVPRETPYEDTGGNFFLDRTCEVPDPIEDDQSIFFNSEDGTVVLLGCAHSGIVNTLRYIRSRTGNLPIQAVIGGTHLVRASEERMASTVEALKELEVRLIAPVHCTGASAQARIASELSEIWEPTHVGSRFEFPRPE